MFREMRRKKQLLSRAAALEILNRGTSGVLGVSGDEGYPYTVPLSYAYQDDKLFFHCANAGHKLDGIQRNDKVTFCVIDRDEVIPQTFTTHFRSVIVFGRARLLTEPAEKRQALECLAAKYSPGLSEAGQQEIDREWKRVTVIEVRIEHLTGKEAIEMVNQAGADPRA
jgi:uncharacterized protein